MDCSEKVVGLIKKHRDLLRDESSGSESDGEEEFYDC